MHKRKVEVKQEHPLSTWIDFKEQESLFDREYANCYAQYASDTGTPMKKWENVTTKLTSPNN